MHSHSLLSALLEMCVFLAHPASAAMSLCLSQLCGLGLYDTDASVVRPSTHAALWVLVPNAGQQRGQASLMPSMTLHPHKLSQVRREKFA